MEFSHFNSHFLWLIIILNRIYVISYIEKKLYKQIYIQGVQNSHLANQTKRIMKLKR